MREKQIQLQNSLKAAEKSNPGRNRRRSQQQQNNAGSATENRQYQKADASRNKNEKQKQYQDTLKGAEKINHSRKQYQQQKAKIQAIADITQMRTNEGSFKLHLLRGVRSGEGRGVRSGEGF